MEDLAPAFAGSLSLYDLHQVSQVNKQLRSFCLAYYAAVKEGLPAPGPRPADERPVHLLLNAQPDDADCTHPLELHIDPDDAKDSSDRCLILFDKTEVALPVRTPL